MSNCRRQRAAAAPQRGGGDGEGAEREREAVNLGRVDNLPEVRGTDARQPVVKN